MSNEEIRRSGLKCNIHPRGSLSGYKYAVVCTFYEGKLVLSRHGARSTWEMQGGHIEDGETPLECAKRELFEESGIEDAELYAVCDYEGYNSTGSAAGVLFIALARSLGELPKSEMAEVALFEELPPNLTYPHMLAKMNAEAQRFYLTTIKND